MVKPHKEKCAHEKFYDKIPDYTKHLNTFEEIDVVCSIGTVKEQLKYQGKICMLLGYEKNHNGGTYCMLNLCTKRIVLSRGIIWINKIYR